MIKHTKSLIDRLCLFLIWLSSPGESLIQRLLNAGIWNFVLRIADRLIRLIRTLVLARLLSPYDFGQFGISLLIITALEIISQTGFRQALIQKKETINTYLDTAWTVESIRGFLIAVTLFLMAPFLAAFFNEPQSSDLIRIIGLSAFFQGITNIKIIYFQKEFKFHKQFVYYFSGTVIDLAVSITLAILYKNVWALVIGQISGHIIRLIISYIIEPYRPKFNFSREKARELFGFGKWIFSSSLILYFLNQGDHIFVGKVLGATALGLYQMAYLIANLPSSEISNSISQITFPLYSKLQDQPFKLQYSFLKVLQVTSLISFPIAAGIILLASDFTSVLLGEKWLPMVPAMQVLALWGLSRAIAGTTGAFFQGIGKPRLMVKIQLLKLIAIIVLIYPLSTRFEIVGTALTVVLSSYMFDPLGLIYVYRIIKCKTSDIPKLLIVPALGTLVMFGVLTLLKYYFSNQSSLFSILILTSSGIATYIVVMLLFEKLFVYELKSLIKHIRYSFSTVKS